MTAHDPQRRPAAAPPVRAPAEASAPLDQPPQAAPMPQDVASAPTPADAPVDDAIQWRRTHKVTPFLNAWKVAVVVLGVFVYNMAEAFAGIEVAFALKAAIAVGGFVVASLVGLGFSALAWRRTAYGMSADSVFLHSGILWRQQRHVRLDRLQAVDVTQPLLARIFGYAALKVEAAGGADSKLSLNYLTEDEAQRVRNEILARAAGVRSGNPVPAGQMPTVPIADAPADGAMGVRSAGPAGPGEAGQTPASAQPSPPQAVGEAPERTLFELPGGRLLASLLRQPALLLVPLALIALVVASVMSGNIALLTGALPAMVGALPYVWGRFAGEFAFKIGISADGIRLRHGLLETTSRTVPPGRVQAIVLTQGRFWRSKDWWRVRVNVAGYGQENTTAPVLFPVATWEELRQILPLVLPDLGTDDPLATLEESLHGTGDSRGFTTVSPRARLFDPLTWRRNGFLVTRTAVLLRQGWLTRSLVLVPHEKTQSVAVTQGPWERRRGLAGIALHSTPGPVIPALAHLDRHVAQDFLVAQSRRAREARSHGGPERWMERAESTSGTAPPPAPEGLR